MKGPKLKFLNNQWGLGTEQGWVIVLAHQATQAGRIDSLESIPGLLRSLKIQALFFNILSTRSRVHYTQSLPLAINIFRGRFVEIGTDRLAIRLRLFSAIKEIKKYPWRESVIVVTFCYSSNFFSQKVELKPWKKNKRKRPNFQLSLEFTRQRQSDSTFRLNSSVPV